MATEVLTRQKCDRCGDVIMETQTMSQPAVGVKKELLCLVDARKLGVEKAAQFEDLCEKCKKRCKNLVEQLLLLKEDPATPAAG